MDPIQPKELKDAIELFRKQLEARGLSGELARVGEHYLKTAFHSGASLQVRWRWNKGRNSYEYFVLNSWWPAADVEAIFSREEMSRELMSLWSPIQKVPIDLDGLDAMACYKTHLLYGGHPVPWPYEAPERVDGIDWRDVEFVVWDALRQNP